jgi:cytochrome c oxidase cbb3-type subunit IV
MMDSSTTQSALTVIMFLLFIGIVAWAWSGKRKSPFDAAAQLPFKEDASAHDTEKTQ